MTAPAETFESVRDRFLTHIRSRGTDAPPAAVHEKLAGAYATLDGLLAELPAETATAAPGPGQWSVRDVVDHLLETERPNLDELRCLVVGERPSGPPIAASLRSRAPHRRPWPWLVAEISRLHGDILEAAAAGPAPAPGEPTAPAVIWVKVDGEPGSGSRSSTGGPTPPCSGSTPSSTWPRSGTSWRPGRSDLALRQAQ